MSRIEEIKDRLAKASKRNWEAKHHVGCSTIVSEFGEELAVLSKGVKSGHIQGQWEFEVPQAVRDDAIFLAHAYSDIEFLLSELNKFSNLSPAKDETMKGVCHA